MLMASGVYFRRLQERAGGVLSLPPGPELHPDVSDEPPRHEIEYSPLAAEDLGVSRHLGLQEEGNA